VTDPLHGDSGSVLTGDTAPAAAAMQQFARESSWRVVCSQALLEGLADYVATGRTATVNAGGAELSCVEVLSLT